MEFVIDGIVSTVVNSFDSLPVTQNREERFLSFLICKNLRDLCETGCAILNDIESKGCSIDLLPKRDSIALCQQVLTRFYSNDMFIEDPEFGHKPNWVEVAKFNGNKGDAACKIYRAIRKNIIEKPGGKDIQKAIKNKNKKFFLENFDKIFADIPESFTEALLKFKNFVSLPDKFIKNQDYIWDFFGGLIDVFIYEKDNLKDLKIL
jgi:hypothetical protein